VSRYDPPVATEDAGPAALGERTASIIPSAELLAFEWERIQAVLRLRPHDIALDPAGLRLRQVVGEERPLDAMAPTASGQADDGTVWARFNVMLGPGQRPLATGPWTLELGDDPLPISSSADLRRAKTIRLFRYRRGRTLVRPLLDGGHLVICVVHARKARAGRRPARRQRRIPSRRSLLRGARRSIFDRLVRVFRAMSRPHDHRIVFTSDSRADLSGNLAVVHARILERGIDRDHRIETIFKPSIHERRPWRDRMRLPRLLGQADVILLDDYQPAIYRLPHDDRVRIIQLWHASGAFKTVGYSRIGKPGGPSPFAMRHKNYTHAIVSGHHDIPFYAEAFGLPEERVVPTGIPRMDRFFDEEQRAAGRARAGSLFPAIEGRMTILFAPTFRGTGPRNAHYDYGRLDLAALHALAVEKDAVVIVKMHPFIREPLVIASELRDRIIDATTSPIDVNDLLFAVDVLVTDYSSIVFEFSTLLRPMLFYAYDLDEYIAHRDFYVPFEEFVPGRIVRTFDQLLAAIRDDDYEADKVAAFARRHFDHLDGRATDRIIDELILDR
jgi:CDP-ribitol ribitolphosphotransferase / teichoic acid ribitol-phosphate polymerase